MPQLLEVKVALTRFQLLLFPDVLTHLLFLQPHGAYAIAVGPGAARVSPYFTLLRIEGDVLLRMKGRMG